MDGRRATVVGRTDAGASCPHLEPELAAYAHQQLGARYVFWAIEEPYVSKNVMPFFSKRP